MTKIGLKGASGLGDSIYGFPIIKHYAKKYDQVYCMSNYPELFSTLENVSVHKHVKLNYIKMHDGTKQPIDIRYTYTPRKYTAGTSQFTDALISAGIKEDIKLEIPWGLSASRLALDVWDKAKGKLVCVMAAPYEPFGRDDEWGKILRIQPTIMQDIVNSFNDKVFFILVGNTYVLHDIKNVGIDLVGKTTVSELLDLVTPSDFGISQIGNLLPICEALNKRNFIIFNEKAMQCDNRFIAAITPEKTVHYKKLNKSIKDTDKNYLEAFDVFINKK